MNQTIKNPELSGREMMIATEIINVLAKHNTAFGEVPMILNETNAILSEMQKHKVIHSL